MNDDKIGEFSEITILPDGRLYVFGLTRPLLELLAAVPTQDEHWRGLLKDIDRHRKDRAGDET